MHREVMEWLDAVAPKDAESVIEIGSRNVNGTPRVLFKKAVDAGMYLGVDIESGDGVDIVVDAASWNPPPTFCRADVVLCCEVFEHTPAWREILKTMASVARQPRGMVIVTAAGPAREPHSAKDGGPLQEGEHYGNIEPGELMNAMKDVGLVGVVVFTDRGMQDVRAVGVAP